MKLSGIVVLCVALFTIGAREKRYLLANIGLVLVLVFAFELLCFFLLGIPAKENKDFSLTVTDPDHIATHLGSVPWSDSVYHDLKMNGSDTVYNAHYTIDTNNIRVTPDHDALKKKHALFFGCSIAFGLGLDDNKTLPFQFQNASPYNAYNFAYEGYGTNQMLARLQFQHLPDVVQEKEGIAVYVFFWDHIERAIGSMDRYTKWVSNAPYYEMKDGKLTRNKTFKDGRSFVSSMYERLYQSSIIQYFEVGFPLGLNDDHFDLVSEMVKESRDEYQRQFGENEFYLAIYPSYTEVDPEKYEKFLSYLKQKDIKVLDLTEDFTYGPEHTFAGDPHPNAETNRLMSEKLLILIEKEQRK